MAFHYTNSFLFLTIILPALPFMTIPTFAANPTGSLIYHICCKSINPPLCFKALKSDPRSAHADLCGLGLISIELVQSNAKDTFKMITLLAKNVTDPRLRGQYETCLENYDDAISNLDDAKNFLKLGDYASLNIYASAVVTDTDTCDESFLESPGSAPEPPQLQHADKLLEDLCDIILIIANMLAGLES